MLFSFRGNWLFFRLGGGRDVLNVSFCGMNKAQCWLKRFY